MSKNTDQMKKWRGRFGKEYTKRNVSTLKKINKNYKDEFGITKTEMYKAFIGKLDKSIKILEVGSNIGNQLLILQKLGFKNLYGIEINKYAIEEARLRLNNINIIDGSALDIPFKDNFFDLVFTSGVLIHISPRDINLVIKEIYRCSKNYILGYEYYADKYTEVIYRGNKNLLWKTNFSRLFLNKFPKLRLIKRRILKYKDNDNRNIIYLLEKK